MNVGGHASKALLTPVANNCKSLLNLKLSPMTAIDPIFKSPVKTSMAHVRRSRLEQLTGPHHEIYLSDPRRVPLERLNTILREPAIRQKLISSITRSGQTTPRIGESA